MSFPRWCCCLIFVYILFGDIICVFSLYLLSTVGVGGGVCRQCVASFCVYIYISYLLQIFGIFVFARCCNCWLSPVGVVGGICRHSIIMQYVIYLYVSIYHICYKYESYLYIFLVVVSVGCVPRWCRWWGGADNVSGALKATPHYIHILYRLTVATY